MLYPLPIDYSPPILDACQKRYPDRMTGIGKDGSYLKRKRRVTCQATASFCLLALKDAQSVL
jgi:hypothetical protein